VSPLADFDLFCADWAAAHPGEPVPYGDLFADSLANKKGQGGRGWTCWRAAFGRGDSGGWLVCMRLRLRPRRSSTLAGAFHVEPEQAR
jgi:hypothetical protein